jgi:hypothetical protein
MLTVFPACVVNSSNKTPHHGNFHCHWVIAASERMLLPTNGTLVEHHLKVLTGQ